ncbi:MAG: ATP-binding protein [Chloroflexi bacterium]|nr:ATP-binding protein [Chloroflexota bacterium]
MTYLSGKFRNLQLAAKFSIGASLLVAITIAAISLLSLDQERQHFRHDLEEQANLLLLSTSLASDTGLYELDAFYLSNLASEISGDEVLNVRFYDDTGRLVADNTGDPETLFIIEPNATGIDLLDEEEPLLRWEDERLFAGRNVLLGNGVVGAVSLELSTEELNTQIAATRNQAVGAAFLAIIAAIAVAYALSRSITAPIRQLAQASSQVAEGNYKVQYEGNASGEVGELVNSFNTMTEAIRLKTRDLQRATRDAQEASRLKDEFLSVMSHELRTPLNAMIGFLGIVQMTEKQMTDKGLHRVERARSNAERLLALINDILDISRIESGRMQLVPTPVNIRQEVAKLNDQMAVLAEEKGLSLVVSVDKMLPEMVTVDEDAFTKIATNLVGNAIKFTEEGQVTLALLKDTNDWIIEVKDTGVGIPAHMHQIIFERFRQVDGSTKRKYGGSGLGLAITASLIRAMNGTINVTSAPNEGATFTVRIPIVDTARSQALSRMEVEVA